MKKRRNYYEGLAADYSKPEKVPAELEQAAAPGRRGVHRQKRGQVARDRPGLHAPADRGREQGVVADALRGAAAGPRATSSPASTGADLVYLCQDGPYHGLTEQQEREKHWWALIAQPGVTMAWPIVMFHGEFVWFEWNCIDDATRETIAKGSVAWVRRGHRGGCYIKGEQLTFYRDVFAPQELLDHIRTERR